MKTFKPLICCAFGYVFICIGYVIFFSVSKHFDSNVHAWNGSHYTIVLVQVTRGQSWFHQWYKLCYLVYFYTTGASFATIYLSWCSLWKASYV